MPKGISPWTLFKTFIWLSETSLTIHAVISALQYAKLAWFEIQHRGW